MKARQNSLRETQSGVRSFLVRIHKVLNTIDSAPFVTFAAVHGLAGRRTGSGAELRPVVADKMARFGFRS
jgi:hypothetical protein